MGRQATFRSPTRALKRSQAVVWGTVTVLLASFCSLIAFNLVSARTAALDRASESAASVVSAIESDVRRNIETLDLSLQAVRDGLSRPEVLVLSPELRHLVLFDRSATARQFGAILVLDENGIVRLDSRSSNPAPADHSSRDYFEVQKLGRDFLYVSHPFLGSKTGEAMIGISRPLKHTDGSFAGVVMGSIRLDHLKELFKNSALGAEGNITLIRTDGTMVMRWPFDPSMLAKRIMRSEFYQLAAISNTGQFEAVANIDQTRRLYVFREFDQLPLVLFVGQSVKDLYAAWRGYAWMVGAMMLLLSLLAIAMASMFVRELKYRHAAEQRLGMMAATDALTGLANRRRFDFELRQAWRRGRQERLPVSLLMIDADHFKAYNDLYGHVQGDELLKALGAAISGTLRPAQDLGARYGGDEFAVLLPTTHEDGAVRVAERIQTQFKRECVRLGIAPDTLSIGAAGMVPRDNEAAEALIEASDTALYAAKQSGRDRVARRESPMWSNANAAI